MIKIKTFITLTDYGEGKIVEELIFADEKTLSNFLFLLL